MTTRYVPARYDLIDHTGDTVPGNDDRIIQGATYYIEFDADISLSGWDMDADDGIRCTLRNLSWKEIGVSPSVAFINAGNGTFSMSIGSTKMEDIRDLEGYYEIKVYDNAAGAAVDGDPYELIVVWGKWKMRRLITE